MNPQDQKTNLLESIATLELKMDFVLSALNATPDRSKFMTAQDVDKEIGIDQRTILNRSNLSPVNKNYIPSVRFGGRRKYFERKVIEKIFSPSV
ncbi:hypothetical protein NC796_02165 [Aliifodinibius sp. S!AR15-10]|uniref:hypothetical protein n=1 Tax=Aliifodinibius sp. S!AR15-10 TaxID=2950437 RepID=UPI002867676C|nr:hypothetical protein [Aliifodinibius sp. S!AR15-10]MDR8389925.1 hypothetical protein [Aliifodinibius sp. S!AR15-10]